MSPPHSLSFASVDLCQRILASLVNILKKASKAPNSAAFVQARIADDMLPLSFQVLDVGRQTMRALRAATGKALETPVYNIEEVTTMAELIDYAEAVLAVANTVKAPDDLQPDAETTMHTFELPIGTYSLKGLDWMLYFGLPNAHFHLVTAYNILRMNGVPLQKTDYILPFLDEDTIDVFRAGGVVGKK